MQRLASFARSIVIVISVSAIAGGASLSRYMPHAVRVGITTAWQVVSPAAFAEVD